MYSRSSRYAMQAIAYMAKQPLNRPIDIDVVSESVRLPPAYLAKIFQGLVRAGLVSSRRGREGGFSLARDPKQLTLLDVVNAVEDVKNSPLTNCIMGFDRCSDENACPLHDIWTKAAKRIKHRLETYTVKDLTGFNRRFRSNAKSRRVLSSGMRAVFK